MRILLAVAVLSGVLFVSGCGRGDACLPPPPPRQQVATIYSAPPLTPPAPVYENNNIGYCDPCAGF